MPVLNETTTPAEQAACRSSASPCAGCEKRAGHNVLSGSIHSYGSEPRNGWVPRYHESDATTAPTFGVELETQPSGRWDDRRNLTGEESVAVTSPRGFWHAQHDGSVSGPELTSQPGTLAYWRSIRPSVASMMRTLIHGGMRSMDGPESCSMHVNIGATAFGSDGHLARFIRLATVNPKWTTRMAQRTHSQVASWARYDAFPDMAACESYARMYRLRGYASGAGHGSAVNLENSGRIEFRSPRGTLRVDRFYAKLEWVAAMVEYTRDENARPAVGNFVPWVIERRAAYPELVAYMADMTPGRLAPRPARSSTHVVREEGDGEFYPADLRAEELAADARTYPCRGAGYGDGPVETGGLPLGYQCELMHGHDGPHAWGAGGRVTWEPLTDDLMTDALGRTYTEAEARAADSFGPSDDAARGVCQRCGYTWGGHYGMFCSHRADGIASVWMRAAE